MVSADYPAHIEQAIHDMRNESGNFPISTSEEEAHISSQLASYDAQLLSQMRAQVQRRSKQEIDGHAEPLFLEEIGSKELYREAGLKLLKEGKIACVILAGGQGTRLGIKGPKGCLEVTPVCGKSLFALLCDKIKGASELAGRDLQVAIMTSPQNHEETLAYFRAHNYFGLNETQLAFYQQNMLPLLDRNGALFLEKPGHIAEGPDGNGRALHLLKEVGILERWQTMGVDYISVVPIDNPLADPFDYPMIGYQKAQDYEVIIKAVEKKSPDERVGVIGARDGHLVVIEYSELPLEQAELRHSDGTLRWNASNTGLFAVKLSYVQHLDQVEMPWHIAEKAGHKIEAIGGHFVSTPIDTLKFETFIFDSFIAAERFGLYPVKREEDFSPIKRPTGSDSVDQAKEDLIARDKRYLESLGVEVTGVRVECDPKLYYLTGNELNKIKKIIIHDGEYYTIN